MPRDISRRLNSLKARRTGTDRMNRIATADHASVLLKSLLEESYQTRSPNRPYTRYALGAMQEVGPEYTRVSIETATRIQGQLSTNAPSYGRGIGFRLQGSVPCNIHIRGVSDVDLLVMDVDFLTYANAGFRARSNQYGPTTASTSLSILSSLRRWIETTLISKFPAATVDVSGGKAVSISGGSLARPVDAVPAHWYDTVDYQQTSAEHDRGVTIFDKKKQTTIDNLPFKHIKLITDKDTLSWQGLKKAIRLCKNVKSDAIEDGKSIDLPSFDIAATMYHANIPALRVGITQELVILAEAQRHLDHLACNFDHARTLIVPDGSRRIFDSEAKLNALRSLSVEMDELLKDVWREQNALASLIADPGFSAIRDSVSRTLLPAAS